MKRPILSILSIMMSFGILIGNCEPVLAADTSDDEAVRLAGDVDPENTYPKDLRKIKVDVYNGEIEPYVTLYYELEDGNIISLKELNDDGTYRNSTTYEYEDHKLIKSVEMTDYGKVDETWEYTYDGDLLVKKVGYDDRGGGGLYQYEYEYFYENDLLVKETNTETYTDTFLNYSRRSQTEIIRAYDDNGHEIMEKEYKLVNGERELQNYATKEYDDEGRVIIDTRTDLYGDNVGQYVVWKEVIVYSEDGMEYKSTFAHAGGGWYSDSITTDVKRDEYGRMIYKHQVSTVGGETTYTWEYEEDSKGRLISQKSAKSSGIIREYTYCYD
ncbi:MAG: hypothetical protein J6U54_13905 [Clostridiales bacterium]|nr:hypothetical protein [Clostridiales bacterium]